MIARYFSPIGAIALEHEAGVVTSLRFAELEGSECPREIARALDAFFRGEVQAIEALQIRPEGSAFQHQVWRALREIPAGRTSSYAELALRIERPSAVRAVARANATNPIAILVPCHRVIGANGELRGYAYGVERKRWLLDHERRSVVSERSAGEARNG
jgi:methylated-DNA-[protein]-cysteine S-methyltransferase